MSELAAILAGVAAASLAVAFIALRKAADARKDAATQRKAIGVLLRALQGSQATTDRLAHEVRSREKAIGELLDRMNRDTVAAVASRRQTPLGQPIHRVDPQHFSRN